MSQSGPELPSLCHLSDLKTQISETIEVAVEVSESLTPKHKEHGQEISIGKARKRAIAVLIVFSNLVPVRLSVRLSKLR